MVIADDQRLLRTGFRVILYAESDINVVREAPDAHRDRCRAPSPPDVVLIHIRMPELYCLQTATRILTEPYSTQPS